MVRPFSIFALIGYSTFSNFRGTDVSTRPENWDGRDITFVKGADLENRNLQYADAYRAFLAKANLQRADLSGANLMDADLRDADMRKANLHEANLHGADLTDADLRGANLHGATLAGVSLVNSDLRNADFRRTARSPVSLRRAISEMQISAKPFFRRPTCVKPISRGSVSLAPTCAGLS